MSKMGMLPPASELMVTRLGSTPWFSRCTSAFALPSALSKVSAVKSMVPPSFVNFRASISRASDRSQWVG